MINNFHNDITSKMDELIRDKYKKLGKCYCVAQGTDVLNKDVLVFNLRSPSKTVGLFKVDGRTNLVIQIKLNKDNPGFRFTEVFSDTQDQLEKTLQNEFLNMNINSMAWEQATLLSRGGM